MTRLIAYLVLGAALFTGCASSTSEGEGAAGDPAAAPAEGAGSIDLTLVIGQWRVVDDQLGSMELTVTEDLECALVDSRGQLWEFEGEEEEEGVEATLDVSERGLKILINQPETSLEVAGSMNYSKGEATLVFSPMERDGQQVLWLRVYREERREDTLQSVNLIPVVTEGGQPEGGN